MRLQQVILAVWWATCSLALLAQKLVTIGDSQTANCGWQPTVVELTGYTWSASETTTGVDGHRPMAVGGSWIRPKDEASINLRGHDAVYYRPDKIILYGGQNDGLWWWLSQDNKGKTAVEKVLAETPYKADCIDTEIRTLAAFRGLIEYLVEQLPQAQIYLMTHVPVLCAIGMDPDEYFAQYYPSPRFADMDAVIAFEQKEREPKDELIRALGEVYDLPVIDLWKYSGITYYNTADYYDEPAGDCTQVHLNAAGDKLIAQCIAQYLLYAPEHYDASWKPWPDEGISALPADSNVRAYTLTGTAVSVRNVNELNSGLYIIDQQRVCIR